MAERDRGLQAALAALDPGKRQILLLRDFLDLSYVEIAAVLDIVPGTVMSRLHRARLALKQQLEHPHE
jgi:RNA polymerase sigma-70 factor (ECF subfamily)